MKKKLFHILLFITISSIAHGQTDDTRLETYSNPKSAQLGLIQFDSFHQEKIYRIWIGNFQIIEFVKVNDTVYNGHLINYVSKEIRKGYKTVSQTLTIPEYTVHSLMDKFYSQNIETLIDCRQIENYVIGTDGLSYNFDINTAQYVRIYSYWEPEDDKYQDKENLNIKNVRNILNEIRIDINLELLFHKYLDTLGPGTYMYGMVIMKIK